MSDPVQKPEEAFQKSEALTRLEAWKAERQKVAEEARAERIKAAEEDRQERLKAFEEDKARRISEASQKRKEAAEAAETDRIKAAEEKLATLEGIEEVRARLARQRFWARAGLAFRLALFVLLPTVVSAWYVLTLAVPLYASSAVFAVKSPESAAAADTSGILASRNTSGALHDAFITRAYILSPEMMERMNRDHGFGRHFSGNPDPIRRVLGHPLLDRTPLDHFRSHVDARVDIQEGLVTLKVEGRTPADAQFFSSLILNYAQEQVNRLSGAMRETNLLELEAGVRAAEARLAEKRRRLVDLKLAGGGVAPEARSAELQSRIADLETQLFEAQRRLDLRAVRAGSENRQVVRGREEVALLEQNLLDARRVLMGDASQPSLNAAIADYEYAEIEIEMAQTAWEAALRGLDAAKIASAESERYFAVVVAPSADARPSYPRKIPTILTTFTFCLLAYAALSILVSTVLRHGQT